MAVRTCLACLASFVILSGGCADSAPIPGFENLGGGTGQGGTSSNGNTVSTGPGATTGGTTSSTSSTSTTSSTTSTTGGGTSTSTSTSTSTGGLNCMDNGPGESNDTESTAHDLGTIDDCDSSGASLNGMLAGVADVDWYKFTGVDVSLCTVDPTRTITAGDAVRVCKFAQCKTGTEDFTCPGGSTAATSPDGRPGCCADHGFSLDLNCAGPISDDATIYVRIDTQVNDCIAYTYAYHY